MTDIEEEILTVVRRKIEKLEKTRVKKLNVEKERHIARCSVINKEYGDGVDTVRKATPDSVWKALTDA